MFCRYCGSEHSDGARFCSRCGKPTSIQANYAEPRTYTPNISISAQVSDQDLLAKFSERVKINAIIWMVVAIIQILLGVYAGLVLLIIGVLNLITSITDLNLSRTVMQKPVGIVKRVKPLVGPTITLIYNFIFGGMIGVAGSIYYLVAVRGLVIENESRFNEIEENYNNINL